MNEIIREALDYVDPNAGKEEAAELAKTAKGKKGGAAAETPADRFAGQDTA